MASIKELRTKEIRNYYAIPFDKLRVWEGNKTRMISPNFPNLVLELADSLEQTCFDEDKVFVPTMAFDPFQGFIETLEDGKTGAVATEGCLRWHALTLLIERGYKVVDVPFNYLGKDVSNSSDRAEFYAMQLQEDQSKSPLETAFIFKNMIVDCGLTAQQAAKLAGRSNAIVSRGNKVLAYPDLHPFILDGHITMTTASEMIDRLSDISLKEQIRELQVAIDEQNGGSTLGVNEESADEEQLVEPSKPEVKENGNSRKGTSATVSGNKLSKRLDNLKTNRSQDLEVVDAPVIAVIDESDKRRFYEMRSTKVLSYAGQVIDDAVIDETESNDDTVVLEIDRLLWNEFKHWFEISYVSPIVSSAVAEDVFS